MMNSNLSPAQIEQWLRGQANKFTEMADTIHSTFSAGSNGVPSPNSSVIPPSRQVDVEIVVDVMKGRSMRRPEIAEKLGVTEEDVDGILTIDNGFRRNERGWYIFEGSRPE